MRQRPPSVKAPSRLPLITGVLLLILVILAVIFFVRSARGATPQAKQPAAAAATLPAPCQQPTVNVVLQPSSDRRPCSCGPGVLRRVWRDLFGKGSPRP